ncbi:MAG: ATP-binding cassette domain-containing protein [Cyanobacteriota bacterium]|jgi:phosphonate transport system ATP-binding protein|nr:ATP-binding cassette domain-containing protein [Cyanobacteriota bacterium]
MEPLLALRSVSVAGPTAPRLRSVSLCLQAGERVALLGASGAGKSTLLAVANGSLPPSQGQVVWNGAPPARSRRLRRRQQARIGTLWQDLRLIEELSVQQNLNTARLGQWGALKAWLNLMLPLESDANREALALVDLDPHLLSRPVASLSGGQRQRVALARLLRQDAQLWLLDEPLASLDPRRAQDALAMVLRLAQGPRALLLSLHRPDLLAGFDRVIGLRQGEVSFDLPAANLTDDLLTALYRGHAPSEE